MSGKAEKPDKHSNVRASTKFYSSMNVVNSSNKGGSLTKVTENKFEEIKEEENTSTNHTKKDSISNSTTANSTKPSKDGNRDSIKESSKLILREGGGEQPAAKRISTQNVYKIKDVLNSKK